MTRQPWYIFLVSEAVILPESPRVLLYPSPSEVALEAVRLWFGGNREQAESLLLRERSQGAQEAQKVTELELLLLRIALDADEDERVRRGLEDLQDAFSTPSDRVVAWLLAAALAQRTGGPCPALAEGSAEALPGELAAELRLKQASVARLARDPERASTLLEEAQMLAPQGGRVEALCHLEHAEQRILSQEFSRARVHFRAALASFEQTNMVIEAGRALLRYGEAVGGGMPDPEAAAVWLARAETRLGAAATFRDRARLRVGFHRYGRRLPDLALGMDALEGVEALDLAAAGLRGGVMAALDQIARHSPGSAQGQAALAGLPGVLAQPLEQIRQSGADFLDFIGGATLERNRTRSLLLALTALDKQDSVASLAAEAVLVASSLLDAERVILARKKDGSFSLLGASSPGELLQGATLAALQEVEPEGVPASVGPAPARRSERRLVGPRLVCSVGANGLQGVMLADKRRGGQFTAFDRDLALLLAQYLGQSFERLLAHEAENTALAELSATLDAIRDGVLSVDAGGVVRSANLAASRLLRVGEGELVGQSLGASAALLPLRGALVPPKRVDSAVIRLPHGSIVVTARPTAGGRGAVATLVEMDRARQMAMRITSTRPRYGFEDVIGMAPPIQEAIQLGRQIAPLDASVLITGESGTGKEVFAQAIHTSGPRESEPFVGINCAALPRELLEAELFGYEKGAFTGARSEGAVGKFELAGEGTLLLDEIGDMPLDMQVKLLRVLQERVVVRLGGSQERPVRARIIATTLKNLDEAVQRGHFRLDLLFRLRVLHIHLPPLRERPGDIRSLALYFLERTARAQSKRVASLSPAVLESMVAYSWPGNVREMANVIEREVSLLPSDTQVLTRFQMPLAPAGSRPDLGSGPPSTRIPVARPSAPDLGANIEPLAEVERRAFLDAFSVFGGNVTKAARALGVSKVTFYTKLRQWGMHPADEPGPETLRRIKLSERPSGDPEGNP